MPFLSDNLDLDLDRSHCGADLSTENVQEVVIKMHACTLAPKNSGGREDAVSGTEPCVKALKAHIEPCPARLLPLVPPPNYGTVEQGCVYRSAYPQDCNLDFMQFLHVSNVL